MHLALALHLLLIEVSAIAEERQKQSFEITHAHTYNVLHSIDASRPTHAHTKQWKEMIKTNQKRGQKTKKNVLPSHKCGPRIRT